MIRPFILLAILGRSLNVQLTCQRAIVCPGSVVTCECAEATGSLHWTVQPGSNCMNSLLPTSTIGLHEEICDDGHQAVLENIETQRDDLPSVLTSSLNVTLITENLTVTCSDTFGPETVALGVAGT